MKAICPKCLLDLERVERDGLRLEVCPRCGGAWLSADELGKVTAQVEQQAESTPPVRRRAPAAPGAHS
jgi:Zn-finger nucleic acid-binding protein